MDFHRGTFRVRGDVLEIFPANYSDRAIRVEFFGDEIDRITEVDVLTGEIHNELKQRRFFRHLITLFHRVRSRRLQTQSLKK